MSGENFFVQFKLCLEVHVVSCPDPFRKNREGSGNSTLHCLVPEEFNQSHNTCIMFMCAVKIEGVQSCICCDCTV